VADAAWYIKPMQGNTVPDRLEAGRPACRRQAGACAPDGAVLTAKSPPRGLREEPDHRAAVAVTVRMPSAAPSTGRCRAAGSAPGPLAPQLGSTRGVLRR